MRTRKTFDAAGPLRLSTALLLALLPLSQALAQAALEEAQLDARAPQAAQAAMPPPPPGRVRAATAADNRQNRSQQNRPLQGPNCTKGVVQSEKPLELPVGKSTLLRLPNPVTYRTVGSANVAQAVLVPPDGLYVLGVRAGTTNMIIQDKSGACHVVDIIVAVDTQALTQSFRNLMPNEKDIQVSSAANSIILSGMVEDAMAVQKAVEIANAFIVRPGALGSGGGAAPLDLNAGQGANRLGMYGRVINQLTVRAPQQVMLEVKVAEVSKTLLDKLGSNVNITRSWNGGNDSFSLISNFLSHGGGLAQALRGNSTALTLDAQKDDGLVRVLAEPNIMAISGQHASFLSGGKIFIPVAQTPSGFGGTTVTLEEKEFGIGVKFMPTLLNGNRINLKLVSEVSDLSQTGSPFTTINGVTSVLPSLTVRRADTTVQLNDGQSLVIAGLIKNNLTETVKRIPGLGETPVLGALFRSTEFQNDQTELMFVVTPRLVKPLPEMPVAPTDNHVPPSRADVYLRGALEGGQQAPIPPGAM